jgi:2,3-bisphosphoglycerate-dependent phosphoglycerate mutase
MTHLYLIRHAEALSAVEGIIGNSGLSPLGEWQASHLRARLQATQEIVPDVFISSTLLRARQTAQIIAPAFDVPLQFDETIQELYPGEAEGTRVEDFNARFGEVDFVEDPFRPMAPGGESWGQFILRVGASLDRIVRQYKGKTIVLVCHGGVIDASFLYFFRMNAWTIPVARFYTRNTSITHWQQLVSEKGRQHWHLIKYNDAFHLHDLGTQASIPWDQLLAQPASDRDRPAVPLEPESAQARETEPTRPISEDQ